MDLSSTEAKLTRTGYLVGTPQYMSPEQINGVAIDKRSDIYALGVILYEMSTGKPPFRGDTLGQMLIAHLQQILPAIDPKLRNEDVPAGIEWVIRKALAKDPNERYASVQELSADLDRLAAGEPTQAAAWYKDYQPPGRGCRGYRPSCEARRGPFMVHRNGTMTGTMPERCRNDDRNVARHRGRRRGKAGRSPCPRLAACCKT